MRSDPEGILEATIVAMSLEDMESAVAYFNEKTNFEIRMPAGLLPRGGRFIGRAAFAKRLSNITRDFSFDRFQPRTILPDGDGLRTMIDYKFQHRKTGQAIEGTMRLLVGVTGGQIVRWHELHDSDKVEAFIRLVNSQRD